MPKRVFKDLGDRIGVQSDASDPLVDGFVQMCDEFQKHADSTAAGFETLCDAVTQLRKGRSGGSGIYSTGYSDITNVIADKSLIAIQEHAVKDYPLGGLLDKVDVRSGFMRWLALAVQNQCNRVWPIDPKRHEEQEKLFRALGGESVITKAAYTGGTNATGGFLVPDVVANEILRMVYDSAIFLGVGRKIPMTSDVLLLPDEYAPFTVYFSGEAHNLTGGETTFSQLTMNAKKLTARATMSREAVDDNVAGLLPYVQTVMVEQIGYKLDQEVSDGTATNFTGLVTEAGLNSVSTTTTDGEAVTYGDLVQTLYKAGQASTRKDAAWFMHPNIFAAIVNLTDSNGQPIFHISGLPNAPEGTLLGRPVYTCSAMSVAITRGATGNTGNIYFGPTNQLLFGIRQDMRVEATDQVNWGTDQIDVRAIMRIGFKLGKSSAWTKLVGCKQIGA